VAHTDNPNYVDREIRRIKFEASMGKDRERQPE
jgi:hypothetical protein